MMRAGVVVEDGSALVDDHRDIAGAQVEGSVDAEV